MADVKVMRHGGGFVCHYPDGPKVIELGFITASGDLVVVPRDAFDDAIKFIQKREQPDNADRVKANANG